MAIHWCTNTHSWIITLFIIYFRYSQCKSSYTINIGTMKNMDTLYKWINMKKKNILLIQCEE